MWAVRRKTYMYWRTSKLRGVFPDCHHYKSSAHQVGSTPRSHLSTGILSLCIQLVSCPIRAHLWAGYAPYLWGLEPCSVLRPLPSRIPSSFPFYHVPLYERSSSSSSDLFYSVLFHHFRLKWHRPPLILYKQTEAYMYLDSSHTS